MRRPIALLALWLTAAIACTTLGWLTVGMVAGQSRESSLPPLIQAATNPDDAEAAVVPLRPAITTGSTATTSTSTSTSTTSTSSTTTTVPAAQLEALSRLGEAGMQASDPTSEGVQVRVAAPWRGQRGETSSETLNTSSSAVISNTLRTAGCNMPSRKRPGAA